MKKDMRKRKGNLLQKMMAVLLSVVLVVGMLASDLSQTEAYAAGDPIASGTDWTLDADWTLTITSDAGMADWIDKKRENNPNYRRVTKLVIESGITSIGDNAFYNFSSLTEVTIPASVTSIGNDAFENCSSLTEVTIPNSVTSIGNDAFYNCSSLTEVTIPASVTSIGETVFSHCRRLTSMRVEEENKVYDSRGNCNAIIETVSNTLIAGCSKTIILDSVTSIGEEAFFGCDGLTEVTIPASVTSIGGGAFSHCYDLTEVTISDSVASVTSIGEFAFSQCRSLTEVTIPASVTSIGRGAFSHCGSLTEVTILDGVTSIGNEAFSYCSSLTEVTIPNSVTSIGNEAFYSCSSLTEVTIPASVTSIGQRVFSDCNGLMSMKVEEENTVYDSRRNCNAIIETDNNELIAGCSKTVIPDSVTKIGNDAFYNCSSLTEVTIPNSVTSIGNEAFSYCSSLTEVTIPNGVTSIGSGAFQRCSSLTEVTIPNSVTSIGSSAFQYCSSLTEVTIPDSVTKIGQSAFLGCSSLTEVTIPDSVTSIGSGAFWECSSLTEVTIPDSVTRIESYAFWGCSSLKEVTIPDSVTKIGDYAFLGCSSLTEVTIPDSVTRIESCAFSKCSSLIEVTIPGSVTSIGELAFSSCSGLEKVTIQDGVTAIGGYAFIYCSSLTEVTMLGSTPPTCDEGVFKNCKFVTDKSKSIYVPEGKAEDYKAAWTDWADYIAEHTHSLIHHPVVAATCTATGTGEYWSCEGCNKLFSDANAENEIDEVPVLNKLAHSYGGWITDQEATENEAGTRHRDCSMCGYRDTQTIPATGHTHVLIHHPVVAATCMAAGIGEYWSCGSCNKLFSDADAENEINAVPILDKLMHNYGDWISNGDGTHTRICQNAGCSQSETENCSGGTATYTEKAICEKCGGRYGELLADTVAPKGEICIATNRWTSFLHTITFGIFFKETKEVTITAEDQESGVAVVGYYISAKGLEEEEVREIRGWTSGNTDTTTFQISPDERCVIYAKIIDCQGNVTYISSDGLEFDGTGPVISGIRDGESYCSPQVVTVTDNNRLDTVKVNRETVTLQDGKFTLQAAAGRQSVTATDKAGNSTTVTVIVNDGHSFGEWITDQEATENQAGTKHRVCSVCGYKDTQIIPATGHIHTLTHHPAVAATCMATGTGEYWSCGSCNKLFSDAEAENEINAVPILDKLMHNYGDWISNGDDTHTRRCQNAGCSQSETENCSGGRATYTERAVCEKCKGRYGELLADTVAPKGEIRIATNRWTSFLHTITFGIFFKETKEVTITAEDQESGVAVVGYHISAEGLEEEEVREIRGWTSGNTDTTTFQISPDERCVIYAKITDCQGNVTYISSNGLEFDRTGPVISGIRNGESYCSPQTVTVTDNSGLDTVKVNGETITLQDGKFTLQAAAGRQSVTATDKAGNSTTVTVTVNDGHSFGDWITDQEATENQAGTKYQVCSVCGYKDIQTIPATGSSNRPVNNEGKTIIDAVKSDYAKGDEPKTSDNAQLELYATLAMISGLSYLLLYFADRRRGMTEETKKELVSRLARWAKQGGKVRKLFAFAAIFVLLAYYHSIGKKTVVEWKDVYGE